MNFGYYFLMAAMTSVHVENALVCSLKFMELKNTRPL